MKTTAHLFDTPLVHRLTPMVEAQCQGLETGTAPILEQVTETTAELLRFWFLHDYQDTRNINFHPGQRQAILNTIYAHEVLQPKTLGDLYHQLCPEVVLESYSTAKDLEQPKNTYPKYCLKMATGTGKTWVLQALLVWQLLNANRLTPDSPLIERFTRNFLIVAPGLIVYDRLLDAFMGKERGGQRRFEESDLYLFRDLFIPETNRDEVFRFVQSAICPKHEISRKVTPGGLIAITNWHVMSDEGEPFDEEESDDLITPGQDLDPVAVVKSILPLSPGTSQGNDLAQLNRNYERGGILRYLQELPSLMVFNDEAHHIHDVKKEGESTEVEWQKSLNRIADSKGHRFVQLDFSATPYNQVGTGKNPKIQYFPHIIVDFPLKDAMRSGLVKSLVLDKRKEIGALSDEELDFKAERDDDGAPSLSEGQRIMLRAGLTKLNKLASEFSAIADGKHPKMLVMCEDTKVTPLVEDFFRFEGLSDDDILRVDSNKKGEISPKDWAVFREKLFDMDRHRQPRVVVSVLMLREGFDVNNICVIVPLRSSGSRILLEQTIGRGLRLMWRDPDYDDIKRDNRNLIRNGKEPSSMIDVLSIVEHPRFEAFYAELMQEGLIGQTGDDDDNSSSTGDLISVGLRSGFEAYDFAIPFILHEQEETFEHHTITPESLPRWQGMSVEEIKKTLGSGERFHSVDVQSKTRFGDYRVTGGAMTATGYNDYLSRLTKRISELLSEPKAATRKTAANETLMPYMQVRRHEIATLSDLYIKTHLFGQSFEPLQDENWRVLLIDPVVTHIVQAISQRLMDAQEQVVHPGDETEVGYRYLSEVTKLPMRESASILVSKCIYERLSFPSRGGGLERAFIEYADRDSSVSAFCKVHEQKHDFLRLRYLKHDGTPGFYHPDFLVMTAERVYLVETKATDQTVHPNVKRKQKAAHAWCERINQLPADKRMDLDWHYALVGEDFFYNWRDKGASMADILEQARVRPIEQAPEQLGIQFNL
jgi:type III restriction enzyme